MAIDVKTAKQEMKELFGQVPGWVGEMPEAALGGFWTLMRDFELGETKIPNKYKELIGIAVSGATRCRYCALFHTESAKLYGASEEEIAEAGMMGALTMAGSTFLNSVQPDYEQFKKETLEMVAYAKAAQQKQGAQAKPPGKGAHA